MKKTLCLLMTLLLLTACSNANTTNIQENNTENIEEQKQEETKEEEISQPETSDPFTYEKTENDDNKIYVFNRMALNVEDLQQLDLSDEYLSVCAIVFTLARYEENADDSIEMLEYINGPEDVSDYDKSFIKNQMDQYPYVMRSYFDGTTPENNYTVENISITIKENIYSRDEEGYVQLWLHSSGADSDRAVKVRLKESTNQWFLFSDTYKGLMAGIRQAAENDKWS